MTNYKNFYKYTCPDIDRALSRIEDSIETELYDVVEKVLNDFLGEVPNYNGQIVEEASKRLFSQIERDVEKVRSLNEEMRSAAEEIFHEKDDELKEALDKIDSLEEKIYDLEVYIAD